MDARICQNKVMEFLVQMTIKLPANMPESERSLLRHNESVRAAELAAAGALVRVWRIPGQSANWGLWSAEDATSLHDSLSSLPMFPYIEASVIALARHPNDPA
jgi:muconolactone D-isomerase